MAHGLGDAHELMDLLSKEDMAAVLASETVGELMHIPPAVKSAQSRPRNRMMVLRQARDMPVAIDSLNPGDSRYHGVAPKTVAAWRKVVVPLYNAYFKAYQVAETRSAHVGAWEAAFSCLFNKEVERIVQDPHRAPQNPQGHALNVAKMNVGQPPPRADKRFLVEAFWLTLHLRFMLAGLAQGWLEAMSKEDSYPVEERFIWATYIGFIYLTCLEDAQIALQIAQKSESHQQVVKTSLFIMRTDLEAFRSEIASCRILGTFQGLRTEFIDSATDKGKSAAKYMMETVARYRAALRGAVDENWLADNFSATAKTIRRVVEDPTNPSLRYILRAHEPRRQDGYC